MKLKKLIILLSFVLMCISAWSQNKCNVTNDSVKWDLFRSSMNFISKDTVTEPQYFILALVDKEKVACVEGLDSSMIVSMLKNEKSDWGTNLILYSIYKREASGFYISQIRCRLDWVETIRDSDIQYWKDFYKSKQ